MSSSSSWKLLRVHQFVSSGLLARSKLRHKSRSWARRQIQQHLMKSFKSTPYLSLIRKLGSHWKEKFLRWQFSSIRALVGHSWLSKILTCPTSSMVNTSLWGFSWSNAQVMLIIPLTQTLTLTLDWKDPTRMASCRRECQQSSNRCLHLWRKRIKLAWKRNHHLLKLIHQQMMEISRIMRDYKFNLIQKLKR